MQGTVAQWNKNEVSRSVGAGHSAHGAMFRNRFVGSFTAGIDVISVSLVYGIRINPCMGFCIALPRCLNSKWNHYLTAYPETSHGIEFRHLSATFKLQYRRLEVEEVD